MLLCVTFASKNRLGIYLCKKWACRADTQRRNENRLTWSLWSLILGLNNI